MFVLTPCAAGCGRPAISDSVLCAVHSADPAAESRRIAGLISGSEVIKDLNAQGLRFEEVEFSGRRFFGCNFSGAEFRGCKFSGVVMRMSFFDFASFSSCDFSGGDFQCSSSHQPFSLFLS